MEINDKVKCQGCGLPRNREFALEHPCSACGELYTEAETKKALPKEVRIQMELELGAALEAVFGDIIYGG